jgi:hypothetical protein
MIQHSATSKDGICTRTDDALPPVLTLHLAEMLEW